MNTKRNIPLNYAFLFLAFMRPTISIWVLFMTKRGLSLLEIGLLESIFHMGSMILEVPTGALADIYGRKIVRIFGRISAILSTILMIISSNFLMYAVSFILSALSYNLESGTGDALLYESCEDAGINDKYDKILGKAYTISTVGDSIGALIGGFLISRYLYMPYYIELLSNVIALIISMMMKEVKLKEEKKVHQKAFEGIKYIFKEKCLLYFFIIASTFSASMTSISFYNQKYFTIIGIPVVYFGAIFFAQGISNSLGSYISEKIERALKIHLLPIAFVASILIVVMLSIAKSFMGVVLMILLEVVSGILETYFVRVINKRIENTIRATVISTQSLMFSLFMIILFPLVGYIADKFNFFASYICISGLLLISLSMYALFTKKLAKIST
ncbi:MFS transporter [Thermoanaerobacterium thermosaccharolyticum]|uniref:Arabinose efflux permease family protein n=1 Tax=Thermoanaerobacterium thermosaccharolyticum M0795 TaxID=698948 RepID=L0IFZ4_THETR|nr:MFS transporter [Thermoanaerobacterium thermosaccharolyticum]AGB18455.1 arabinose efflux permease family protein [Thermoanaerobacterium thermosaccharolyticum M0795]